jgi:hypothetical protein
MKTSELRHAYANNQMTERRNQFLWTADMLEKLERKQWDSSFIGMNARLTKERITQGETPLEVRQNPNVLQHVVINRIGDCVRYSAVYLEPGSPSLKDMLKSAVTVEKAIKALTAPAKSK